MNANSTHLSTSQLQQYLQDPQKTLIDVRPIDAYNGWKLRDEPRGGHIPGATCLPAKWTKYLDWPDIVATKGLKPHHQLLLYGYHPEEIDTVKKLFDRIGFEHVSTYYEFMNEWSPNHSLPLQQLPRFRHLVPARWLHTLLRTGKAPEYQNNRFILCHAHYRNPDAYHQGHIPGAIQIDTNDLESTKTWNCRPPHELKIALQNAGITHDTTVILYGRFASPNNDDPFPGSSAGHLGAIRCAFIMLYAGVSDIRILNGGLQSWLDQNLPITTEETPPSPASDFGIDIPANPQLVVDTPQAKKILHAPDQNLVSVRSWREFIGEVSGYNYIDKKGRIPGAVFGNCGSDAYHMENYRNADHTMREFHEIQRIWAEAGITPQKRNAFYCGTGWRGSEAFFHAWLMGWPNVALYDGGWFEWSSDENNPYQTGPPN